MQARKRRGSKEDTVKADRRAERLQRVGAAYLKGLAVIEIAKREGLTRYDIYNDLKRLRKIWWKRNNLASEQLVAEQVAKLDAAEAAAWQGWEKSCRNYLEVTKESGGERQDGTPRPDKTTRKRRGQSGDPSFLAVISRIVDQRCKLLRIGQYANEDTGVMVAAIVEVVVDDRDQIPTIMDFGDYQSLTASSQIIESSARVIEGAVDENSTNPDQ